MIKCSNCGYTVAHLLNTNDDMLDSYILCHECFGAFQLLQILLGNDTQKQQEAYDIRFSPVRYNSEGVLNRHFAYRYYEEKVLGKKVII